MNESIAVNTELNRYWGYIQNASDEIKLKLISMLSLSIADKENRSNLQEYDDIRSIFGLWTGNESAEKIIANIKSHPSIKNPPVFDWWNRFSCWTQIYVFSSLEANIIWIPNWEVLDSIIVVSQKLRCLSFFTWLNVRIPLKEIDWPLKTYVLNFPSSRSPIPFQHFSRFPLRLENWIPRWTPLPFQTKEGGHFCPPFSLRHVAKPPFLS